MCGFCMASVKTPALCKGRAEPTKYFCIFIKIGIRVNGARVTKCHKLLPEKQQNLLSIPDSSSGGTAHEAFTVKRPNREQS